MRSGKSELNWEVQESPVTPAWSFAKKGPALGEDRLYKKYHRAS